MSPRTRVVGIVALAAAVVVAAVVGGVLLQTRGESSGPKALKGAPPLFLEFGLEDGPEARALASAQTIYDNGRNSTAKRARAAAIFARYHSLDAELGAAFAAWPHGSLDAVKRLVASHPGSSLAELHLGWAFYWSGRDADAIVAWRRATSLEPDSPAAVDAQDPLHPGMFPGLPYIIVPLSPPAAVAKLSPPRQLAALARTADRPGADADAKLLYGVTLWHLKQPVSAERELEAAARLAPHDPTVLTAAAVGAFTKSDPVHAFSLLGPLTGAFPRASVVRFHLGLLLLWTHQYAKAARQLHLAIAIEPRSVYAKQAKELLALLPKAGTK